MVVDDKILKERFGVTQEEIDDLKRDADAYDRGEWPEGVTVRHVGRPSLSPDEDALPITIRVPESQIKALDTAAKEQGTTRSGAIRAAIDQWLKRAATF